MSNFESTMEKVEADKNKDLQRLDEGVQKLTKENEELKRENQKLKDERNSILWQLKDFESKLLERDKTYRA